MDALEERRRFAASSILENEQLTADLDDAAADTLLQWGLALAEKLVMTTQSLDDPQAEEALYKPMRGLRKLMRAVNNWASSGDASYLTTVWEQADIVYGKLGQQTAVSPADDALANLQTINDLRQAIETTTAESPTDAPPPPQKITPQERMALLRQALTGASDPAQIVQARQQSNITPSSGQENDQKEDLS